ncbi:SdiA-regulated domain-containing protein [Gluconobacter japonicus]|uniref:SdiA-regulated domain-containing protein n=1 Tax=Gluconobacter japonicus TaxID=376620 RepID=UPI001B8CC061|nr:SdiA-regulated domain-containing protein [Gluconobacter japonicus]MBS1049184.1 hypothetical protein [Gluconobacter japonicus]
MSRTMKSWLLHSVSAVLLGTSCLFAFPAYADHPWKDASQPAGITTDAPLENVQLTALTQHNALSLLGLDVDGRPVLIDSANQEHPFPENETERAKIPSLSALTKQNTIFWGLAASPEAALVQLSSDGKLLQTIPLQGAHTADSRFTAIQVDGNYAYLTDEGQAALVVVALKNGKAQRFLPYDPSVTGRRPLKRNDQITNGPDNHPLTGGNVRFLALDTKGQWLFYMPACGPLYRIGSALLTDPAFTPVEQLDGIVEWRDTPSLGGLTLSADNIFYMSDITDGALLKFGSDRNPLILLRDKRLLDAGAVAVSGDHEVSVLTSEDGKPHILRIALP